MLELNLENIQKELHITNFQILPENKKFFYEFIKDSFYSCRVQSVEIKEAKYHHNTSYEKTPLVIKNGILSLKEIAILENRTLTQTELNRYNDDCHVNGSNQISLSSLDIDYSTVSKKEWLYDPYFPGDTDIRISSSVKAYRNSKNYANEYLVDNKVLNNDFRAIDIRILKLIKESIKKEKPNDLEEIINNYNNLKEIALELLKCNLDIPLREMSEENITLDLFEIIKLPKLILKKK